jgi:hypothetical protein
VSEIKKEKQLAGSTTTAQDLKPSSENLSDGNEPDGILLALLWSSAATLIERNKALLATANYQGQPTIVIVIPGAVPTDSGLEFVGTANKDGPEKPHAI